MGLLDDLLSGALGAGNAQGAPSQSQGGMSPVMMALMALMAYRALSGGGTAQASPGASRGAPSSGNPLEDILGGLLGGAGGAGAGRGGGGLADILGGMLGGGATRGDAARRGAAADGQGGSLTDILGGMLAGGAGGGALGNVLNGGLDDILKQLQQNGQGDVADSWIGKGTNKPINPNDLDKALGPETMKSLAEQAGVSHIQFMQGLAAGLPQIIDQMTPQGRMPTRDEVERWI